MGRRFMVLLHEVGTEPYIEFIPSQGDLIPYLNSLKEETRTAYFFVIDDETKAAMSRKYTRHVWAED